jgi:hypothetical protein
MNNSIIVDNLTVEIRRSGRRRHVDLTVERDGSVVVAAPDRFGDEEVEKLVRSRLVNLHSHIARKREILSNQPVKEYVTGEGFYYLGRKYRLKLVDDGTTSLRLLNGRFLLPRAMAAKGREAFIRWYTEHGQQWLRERAIPLEERVAIHPTSITVRDLGFRWGSCAESGAVNFHWRIILLPPKQIDYLILHELCHLHEHDHSRAFYTRLGRAVPDHGEHEEWLRTNGDRFNL